MKKEGSEKVSRTSEPQYSSFLLHRIFELLTSMDLMVSRRWIGWSAIAVGAAAAVWLAARRRRRQQQALDDLIAIQGQPDRFLVEDRAVWLAHLREQGYVVIASAASTAEVAAARALIWEAIEMTCPGVACADPASWAGWPADRRGFLLQGSITQSRGAWYVRSLPRVREAFEAVWGTRALLVSMDALIAWPPWGRTRSPPVSEGLHLDQNPFDKRGLQCVQGMVCLYDVDACCGGLAVVPRSHADAAQEYVRERCPLFRGRGDWCVLPHRYYQQKRKQKCCTDDRPAGELAELLQEHLVLARAGDLILWDSRTAHGAHVAVTGASASGHGELARLSLAVCMSPAARASAEVLAERTEGFAEGATFTHWPHEATVARWGGGTGYAPITLSAAQRALLDGTAPSE